MLNWGQKKLTSDKELRQVRMHIVTQPAGLFGRLVGRALRLRVDRFFFVVNSKDYALQRVEVEADSVVPESEVLLRRKTNSATAQPSSAQATTAASASATAPAPAEAADRSGATGGMFTTAKELNALTNVSFEERVPLSLSESNRLVRRARGYVLDVPRYPYIQFDVEAEDKQGVQGMLHLHGDSHSIRCAKTVEGSDLVVRCPVSLKQFQITPFKLWLGLFSVADTVFIETRVPASALKL